MMADVSTKVLFEAEKGVQAKVNKRALSSSHKTCSQGSSGRGPQTVDVTRADAEDHTRAPFNGSLFAQLKPLKI